MDRKIVLEVKNLGKYFNAIKAIDGVDMKLYENEILAIVGDNGAGKSTLIKTISGVYSKNFGSIYINGKEAEINNALDAKKHGIETVYQDSSVIPLLDASSNIFLGREKIRQNFFGRLFKILDFKYMREETRKVLNKFGIDLKDLDAEVANLSGGQRQSVSIGRAAYWGGKIIILDEPTNNLGVKQENKVMDLIRKLSHDFKVSIIIITHNIDHVFQLVDRIVVLRNGKKVGDVLKKETDKNDVVAMITGVKNIKMNGKT